jgi:hypothetical protein
MYMSQAELGWVKSRVAHPQSVYHIKFNQNQLDFIGAS